MKTYQFAFSFYVTTPSAGRSVGSSALERILEELMHVMVESENDLVFDSAVGATLSEAEVDVEVAVNAADEDTAAALARDFISEAIRSTGGTPMGFSIFPPPEVPPETSAAGPRRVWHGRQVKVSA